MIFLLFIWTGIAIEDVLNNFHAKRVHLDQMYFKIRYQPNNRKLLKKEVDIKLIFIAFLGKNSMLNL